MQFSDIASIPPASPQYLPSSFTMTPCCGQETLERGMAVTLNQHLLMSIPSTGELLTVGWTTFSPFTALFFIFLVI